MRAYTSISTTRAPYFKLIPWKLSEISAICRTVHFHFNRGRFAGARTLRTWRKNVRAPARTNKCSVCERTKWFLREFETKWRISTAHPVNYPAPDMVLGTKSWNSAPGLLSLMKYTLHIKDILVFYVINYRHNIIAIRPLNCDNPRSKMGDNIRYRLLGVDSVFANRETGLENLKPSSP